MIPSEIHPTDAWPVFREIALLAGEHFFGDGKDAAGTQCWHAFRARLAFMCRVARRNLGFLLSGEVLNVVERHRRDMPIGGLLKQEAANSLAHAEQRRERHPHWPLVDVRAREALSENVGRRLFIEP